MVYEFETTVKTSIYVDDEAGSVEVSNEVHSTAPMTVQAKNDVAALTTAHIIDEMSRGLEIEGDDDA